MRWMQNQGNREDEAHSGNMGEQERDGIDESDWAECIGRYCESTCKAFGENGKLAVMNLIALGHIPRYTIIRYLAFEMYPEKLSANRNHTAAVVDIAVTLGVSERTIWGILNRQGVYIRKKR